MEPILLEGIQHKKQGKPIHSIYKEPQLIDKGVSHVLGLEDTMISYRLKWLTDKLGRYAPMLVWEFYVAYAATILYDLPKEKRPLTQSRLREVLV